MAIICWCRQAVRTDVQLCFEFAEIVTVYFLTLGELCGHIIQSSKQFFCHISRLAVILSSNSIQLISAQLEERICINGNYPH